MSVASPDPLRLADQRRMVAAAGGLAAAIGALVLCGWALEVDAIKSVIPGAAQMKPNAAAALLLAGLALAVRGRSGGPARLFAPAVGIILGLLGLATLAEYMAAVDLGIDQFLFTDYAPDFRSAPGRMSPFTAWAVVMIGVCLVVRRTPALRWLAALGATQVTVIGAISVLGYMWNASDLVTDALVQPASVHGAVALVALGAGLLLSLRRLQPRALAQRRATRWDRATRIAFCSVGALLLTALGYTYRSNSSFIYTAQAIADTQLVRLELSRLERCMHEVEATHARHLMVALPASASALDAARAECMRLLQLLAPGLQADPEQAAHFGRLGAALEAQLAAVEANQHLLARRGAEAARQAWTGGSAADPLRQLHSTVQDMDAVQAERVAAQMRSRSSDRSAMLVSLLVTLVACVTIFGALARMMLETVRETTQAREETEQQKLLLTAVVASAPNPVAYRSPDGTYLGANDAYAKVVGRPVAELVGKNVVDVFGVGPAQVILAQDAQVLRTGEACSREDWFTIPDGSRLLMESMRSPLRDVDGRISGVLAVGRNITQQKEAEAQTKRAHALAEDAARLKTAFLANMSHEIRTPMTAVLGMIDLLSADQLTAQQQRQVQAMRTSGRHLLSVINDILDFSRIEAGKLQLERMDFSMHNLLEELGSLLRPMAAERGLALEIELRPELPPFLRGDPMRLRQVLLNLAGNALKFTPRGQVRITVATSPGPDPLVAFEVRDTGIGIEPEKLDGLFSAFSQADESTAREYGGSGLGLAISKRLAEAMGGRLSASSVVGEGSVFRLEVPLPVGEDAVQALAANPFDSAFSPQRILVAEDVEINRDLLHAALTRQGHHVEFAVNGAEAVEQVQSASYDLVLMDVQMPILDGVEATRRIRLLPPPAGDVPILGLTANVLATEQQHYLAAGMTECLTKPIDWQLLAAAIARHGNGSRPPPAVAPPASAAADRWINDAQFEVVRSMCSEADFADLVAGAFTSVGAMARAIADTPPMAQLEAEAHKLKGLAGTVGFAVVYATACRIEDAAGEGLRADAAIARLQEEIECTGAALRALGMLSGGPS